MTPAVVENHLKNTYLLLFLLALLPVRCFAQSDSTERTKTSTIKTQQISEINFVENKHEPVSDFIRRIHQDKHGNLWLGTNGDGVIRYDGQHFDFYSMNQGFGGTAVREILEDQAGNLWFGTNGGITKYDGKTFINYTDKNGLISNDVWSMEIDKAGLLWIGTLEGVCCFDGKVFTPFSLPATKIDPNRGVSSAKIVHSILQDRAGNMWFSSNGGAFKYDGESILNLTEKDGLCNDYVNCIFEDRSGTMWFATSYNGLCSYNGSAFTPISNFGEVKGTEVWMLYQDKSGTIWFPVKGYGVYRFDGKEIVHFGSEQGLPSTAIQCIFEDNEGQLWLGGWLGLFLYDGVRFSSVTEQEGPFVR